MDPTSLSTTSSATPDFLQSLADIATGYLATRANILLTNEAGGSSTTYVGGQAPATATQAPAGGVFANPIIWIGAGALLFVVVLLLSKGRK